MWNSSRGQRLFSFHLVFLFAVASTSLFALDPTLQINQYSHTAWRVHDAFSRGITWAISQTADGYLWLGTEFGLVRFDGVRAVTWEFPRNQQLPSRDIWSLLATRDGTLWIGTTKGLASWKNEKLTQYPELSEQSIAQIVEDRDGVVWIAGRAAPKGKLCAIRSGKVECFQDHDIGLGPVTVFEDRRGALWVGTDTGVWRWKPGPLRLYPKIGVVYSLNEDDDGALLAGAGVGIRRLLEGRTESFPAGKSLGRFPGRRMLRDRDGGLWIGAMGGGLAHIYRGKTDVFAEPSGLSGNAVWGLFEDREGNIWVSTNGGLDRFRNVAVATYRMKHGLSGAIVNAVLAAKDGSVWIGTETGLNRWTNGQMTTFAEFTGSDVPILAEDSGGKIWVSSGRGFTYWENGRFTRAAGLSGMRIRSVIGDGGGNLWIACDSGLLRWVNGPMAQRIACERLSDGDSLSVMAADSSRGGLWLGFFRTGVALVQEGQVRAAYTASQGLGRGRVNHLRMATDGSVWASTEGGLSRLNKGRVATIGSRNGLGCDTVHWSMEDKNHALWVYASCGLIHISGSELVAWTAAAEGNTTAGRFKPRCLALPME